MFLSLPIDLPLCVWAQCQPIGGVAVGYKLANDCFGVIISHLGLTNIEISISNVS